MLFHLDAIDLTNTDVKNAVNLMEKLNRMTKDPKSQDDVYRAFVKWTNTDVNSYSKFVRNVIVFRTMLRKGDSCNTHHCDDCIPLIHKFFENLGFRVHSAEGDEHSVGFVKVQQ